MKRPITILAIVVILTCLTISAWAALCGQNTYLLSSFSNPSNPAEWESYTLNATYRIVFTQIDPLHRTFTGSGQRRTGNDLCAPVWTYRFDPNTIYGTHWYGTMEGFMWSISQNRCTTTGMTDRQDVSVQCIYCGDTDQQGEEILSQDEENLSENCEECQYQEPERPYDPSGYGELDCSLCQDDIDNDCDDWIDGFEYECWDCWSPVVIDTLGNGFYLTSPENGVDFDISGVGTPQRVSWTQADDAWLALDRNGNGTIDSGKELFGTVTYQASSSERNGFRALAVYDEPANGGNGDGVIDYQDAIFTILRKWHFGTKRVTRTRV
jgi:hypothetical protein